jgi:hypothetical protein
MGNGAGTAWQFDGWVARPGTSNTTAPNTADDIVSSEVGKANLAGSKKSLEVAGATGGTKMPTTLGANAEGPYEKSGQPVGTLRPGTLGTQSPGPPAAFGCGKASTSSCHFFNGTW